MPAREPVSLTYRRDIDRLRAVAILPVVLFHADVAMVRGGFVDADIFFVISGYLITAIINQDIVAGRFSFSYFYERRIRRIYPALLHAGCRRCFDPTRLSPIWPEPHRHGPVRQTRAEMARLAVQNGALIFDPRQSLCAADHCITEVDGVSLYSDDNHIAKSQVGLFHDTLRDALRLGTTP